MADGVHAGLLGMILSVALIVRCFQRVGMAIKTTKGHEPVTAKLWWGIGSTLVGDLVILFSVTYMDQMQVIWYFLLACIAGVEIRKPANRQGLSRKENGINVPVGRTYGGKGVCSERIKIPGRSFDLP